MTLKEQIMEYRVAHDISVEEFAHRCKLTPQTIYGIISGRQHPKEFTVRKIMAVIESGKGR